MIAGQHNFKGLIKFILPDEPVTVDQEVMTLTRIHIYRKDRNCSKKSFISWIKENSPPPTFLKKVKETQGKRSKEFLKSILDTDLEPNFRPKPPCKCPKLAKLANIQLTKEINMQMVPNSDNRQTVNDNIPSTIRKRQAQVPK